MRARARRATSRLRANRVLHARTACRLEMGGSGFCARAPRVRRATSWLWLNRVLPARAACNLEMGGSGFCARARAARHPGYGRTGHCTRAPPAALRWADPVFARARAARHPGYGRTGYCPRAPPASLRWADPVFARARPRARRATSWLWVNRVLPARAACNLEMGGSGFCARACRATSLFIGDRVLPARAACNLEMGGPGFCARARAARHPGYGRTGYCPRAPPAALRWADPVFARTARAPRDIPVMGEPGIARARRLPP